MSYQTMMEKQPNSKGLRGPSGGACGNVVFYAYKS